MKTTLILLFLSASSLMAQQSIDLATLSYRSGPSAPYENNQGNARETGLMANFKMPVVINETSIWYTDLTYQHFNIDYSVSDPGSIMPLKVHGVILQTGWVKSIGEKNAIQMLIVPRFMSDLNEVSKQHFQLGAIGLYEIKYREDLTMRYGLMYNREKFGNMFVPLVYLDWIVAPKWSISGLLPIFAKINYHATEKLTLGFSHFGLITSFQVGDPLYNNDYIERKSIDLALFGRYKFWGGLCFEARAGFAVGRSYLQFAEGDEMDFRVAILSFGDDRTQKNIAFDSGPILDLRLVYNLDLTSR
ncbi:MAG: hypothetical protein KI791_16800 [Cyclobacteriaceae bacterium]|nr:hypothetical protein [Cyclobacteriaceae bacterium SS2]